MLLRSSSTPILGSLLPSSSTPFYSESPHHKPSLEKAPRLFSSSPSQFLHGQEIPIIRKSISDGNLHSLLSSAQKQNQVLDAIQSFSIFKTKENPDEEEEEEEEYEEDGFDELEGVGIGGGTIVGLGFLGRDQNLNLVENSMESSGGGGGGGDSRDLPLFLARGLGIDRLGSGLLNAAGGGGGGGGGGNVTTGSGGERSDVENYYRRMVDEDPSNALFLRNYAQFLYQAKGDAKRAEEYYSRAIISSPGDGEILSQYAKLVWELHNDKERASSYFERSVQATPTDSHVLAAYANFLWETEEDDDNGIGDDGQLQGYFGAPLHQGILTSATT